MTHSARQTPSPIVHGTPVLKHLITARAPVPTTTPQAINSPLSAFLVDGRRAGSLFLTGAAQSPRPIQISMTGSQGNAHSTYCATRHWASDTSVSRCPFATTKYRPSSALPTQTLPPSVIRDSKLISTNAYAKVSTQRPIHWRNCFICSYHSPPNAKLPCPARSVGFAL